MSVADLLDGLDRATVLAAMTPQLPVALVRELLDCARAREVQIDLLVADLTGRWDFLDAAAELDLGQGRLTMTVLAGAVPRRLAGRVEHLPVSLWEADRLLSSGALSIDILLARVQRDQSGAGSYGAMLGYTPSALARARRVGFEVVPGSSAPAGTELDLQAADLLVEAAPVVRPVPAATTATLTQLRIAELTAALVPDAATVQLGVGVIPAEVAARLTQRSDLGLHSGVLPGPVQRLLAGGAVSGTAKGTDPGRHVATGLLGGDPDGWGSQVLLRPLSYTHDPRVLLSQHRLWALNSAYQLDLAGQVNAEYVAGARLSSGGGQADFARAAHAGTGATVISLPSRAGDGSPRIVVRLDCPVTTPGSDVDYVVTEYGVARLTGCTASQRASALIAIAHPQDRAGLLRGLACSPSAVVGRTG